MLDARCPDALFSIPTPKIKSPQALVGGFTTLRVWKTFRVIASLLLSDQSSGNIGQMA